MPPSPYTSTRSPLTANRGDFLGEQYAWSFGDAPGSQTVVDPTNGQTVDLNSGQTTPVTAYVYEQPGTYPVTLTRTTAAGQVLTYHATVTVPASTRTAYYVDSTAGDDANPGTLAAPFKTWAAAYKHFGPHTAFYLKRGGNYPTTFSLWIHFDDVLVDAYGDPTQSPPVACNTTPSTRTPVDQQLFFFGGDGSNVTVRNFTVDAPYSTVNDPYGRPYECAVSHLGYLAGRNVTVSDVGIAHSFNGPHGSGLVHGGLVLRCKQIGAGVASQVFWYEGQDFVAIGNRGVESALESTCRAASSGIVRGTIAYDSMGQLVNVEYPEGSQKSPVTYRTLSDAALYHVHTLGGYCEFAPRSPATLVQYVTADGLLIDDGYLWLKTNVRHLRVRNTRGEQDQRLRRHLLRRRREPGRRVQPVELGQLRHRHGRRGPGRVLAVRRRRPRPRRGPGRHV